ncbi:MAG TPA: FHA domain-containing protein [Blastocatellia bacterium]
MLICPTCRNQNLDTAKFCGNCGNSFTRPSASTSSLINCAQGHVYSAVYEHCPYCPQPQIESRESDFATRVETPITAIDQPRGTGPALFAHSQNTADFATRIDTNENVFETLESPTLPPAPSAPLTPSLIPTEITPAVPPSPPSPPPLSETFGSSPPEPFRMSAPIEPLAVGQENRLSQAPAPQTVPPTLDRRTVMLSDQAAPVRKSKGRIVGWLVTYSHNPDGEDFRIYAGYNRIGANPVCDIQIEDETVSGSHAIIVYRDGRCLIKDDLSRNGTFVNGREITEAQPLQSYDQIRVGNTNLTFVPAARIE